MQVWKDVEVFIEGRSHRVKALFDSGSSITVMGYTVLEEFFRGASVKPLTKPRPVVLANGEKILIEGYVDSKITIDGYVVEERIYIPKDIVKKAVVEGRELHLPELIIGAPTMETWGIELNLERGDVVIRGALLI